MVVHESIESTVGWDADPVVAATARRPSLDTEVTADVCVIGLGGSGLAAVGEALRRGLSVVGIDAGRVAAGAAGRNGGFLLGGPAIAVHQAGAGWGIESALALYRETLAEIRALSDLLGPDVIRQVGSIRLAGLPGEPETTAEAADREVESTDCDEQFRVLTHHGIAVERYDGELGRGLYLPDDAAMNPARRALALADLYGGHARLFENTPMTSVESGSVVTTGGRVNAGAIVIAVDGRLDLVLPELAGRVRTTRLQMLATAPVRPGRLPCPVYGRWGYDYAQQDPSGRIFIGGGRDRFAADEWTTDTDPTPDVQDWIETIAARFAGQPITVTHRWAASVGYTADARPLVTEVRPGVVACGGYNGTGNLVGPIAARAALSLALDGTAPPEYFAT
ncbi:FAD-binding oxidoreductase [Jatrophihabitans telluris]|uniref:FAD-binding oxidoreductase n=1 Tax=Jatrophihabitans telluris TaxID=2038343 RepID=A0ABY4QXE9_9ACTN|nr:FAD-dependent oxidoreductase [Jatrophihabitans telluris]UQX87696.1 FAD-binding oxidoreductase [Jatrophihabitans telluris]